MAEAGKVYVVECGEYSTYYVVGVYSTRERAEFIVKAHGSALTGDKPFIVERRLDDGIEELGQKLVPYRVEMLRNGTILQATKVRLEVILGEDEPHVVVQRGSAPFLHSLVWARDRKHAIDVVDEVRVRLVTEDRWRTGANG